ncbi:hypothetical protein BJ508DRAFT_414783 [Ascobolus immersus RN42]|uniref:Uncharacterized protein n=1 Tax=Ascobolus immersus RN42 TaxID=1160509 RepID=A0A3N4I9J0_ASCIM|nr:hypothetical protein BJ508DRAFT_414783 [Ascobolus immersus RN42]
MLELYWGVRALPLSQYMFPHSELVLCREGIYEIDETQEYMRSWGHYDSEKGRLERGEWMRSRLVELLHRGVLAEIEGMEGPIERQELTHMSRLRWRELMMDKWGIQVYPLVQFRFGGGRSRLLLCEEGVYEVDEADLFVRYRGRDGEGMVLGEWLVTREPF